MRFLDLDLDFFLNKNSYWSGGENARLDLPYKPWTELQVRLFLEKRCRLLPGSPVPGLTIERHDRVIDYWRHLIESGKLKVPFDVLHIDAHPDFSVRGGLRLIAGALYIEQKHDFALLEQEYAHSGNYLTYAISYGWIASLTWVPLITMPSDRNPNDAGHVDTSIAAKTAGRPLEEGVPFEVVPWRKFRSAKPFDYMILSKSPDFTPVTSDALIPVIEEYMSVSSPHA